MSRKIKFRAWDSIHKKMWKGEDYGDSIDKWTFFIYISAETGLVEAILQGDSFLVTDDPYPMYDFEKEILLVMEYTGLRDVDGVEIYDGDILEGVGGEHAQGIYEFNIFGVVEFLSGSFILSEIGNKGASYLQQLNLIMDLTVVGNRFENPELLED